MTNLTLVSGDKPEPKFISKENEEKAIKEVEEFLTKMRSLGFIVSLSYVSDGFCEGSEDDRIMGISGDIENSEDVAKCMLLDTVFQQIEGIANLGRAEGAMLNTIKIKVIGDALRAAGEIK